MRPWGIAWLLWGVGLGLYIDLILERTTHFHLFHKLTLTAALTTPNKGLLIKAEAPYTLWSFWTDHYDQIMSNEIRVHLVVIQFKQIHEEIVTVTDYSNGTLALNPVSLARHCHSSANLYLVIRKVEVIASKMFIVVDFTCLPQHQEDIATFLEANMGFEMETSQMALRWEELAANQQAKGEHQIFDMLEFEHNWDVISVLEALMGSDDSMVRKMKSLAAKSEHQAEQDRLRKNQEERFQEEPREESREEIEDG